MSVGDLPRANRTKVANLFESIICSELVRKSEKNSEEVLELLIFPIKLQKLARYLVF